MVPFLHPELNETNMSIEDFEMELRSRLAAELRRKGVRKENIYLEGIWSLAEDYTVPPKPGESNINYQHETMLHESTKPHQNEIGKPDNHLYVVTDFAKLCRLVELNSDVTFNISRHPTGLGGVRNYDDNGDIIWWGIVRFKTRPRNDARTRDEIKRNLKRLWNGKGND